MALKVLALGGDGIGPEVVDASLKLLDVAASSIGLEIDLSEDLLHGSAPDIAGQGIANPIGMILSVAMMLEYSAVERNCARKIEAAVNAALNAGKSTRDIGGNLGTAEMTDAVIEQFRLL